MEPRTVPICLETERAGDLEIAGLSRTQEDAQAACDALLGVGRFWVPSNVYDTWIERGGTWPEGCRPMREQPLIPVG